MWKYQNTDELYHYGVLGMRWGHRKTLKYLAQHNYNVKRNTAKEQLKSKSISKQQYNNIIKKSNKDRKLYIKEQTNQFKTIKDKKTYDNKINKLKSDYNSKVTNGKEAQKAMKRNRITAVMNTTIGASAAAITVGQTAAMAMIPGLGQLTIGAAAIGAAANIGRAYIKNSKIKRTI